MRTGTRTRAAFSLVELILVIGLLAVIAGLALPAVQDARDAAVRAACQNNLRQVGIGLHHYHDVHNRLPPPRPRTPGRLDTPAGALPWTVNTLPYLEHAAVFARAADALRAELDSRVDPPHSGNSTVIPIYACPADSRLTSPELFVGRRVARASYLGIEAGGVGPVTRELLPTRAMSGAFDPLRIVRFSDFPDGTANTVMVGERTPPDAIAAGEWYQGFGIDANTYPSVSIFYPAPIIALGGDCGGSRSFGPGRVGNRCDRNHFWSLHRGGANFLFADGSVRLLPYSAEPILADLCTRAGGWPVEIP